MSTEKKISFVNLKAAERGATVICGSVSPEVDSVGGNGPSSDGYDAYGLGYTFNRAQTGVFDVVLNQKPKQVLFASGFVRSNTPAALFVQAEHKSGSISQVDKWTVRFRVFNSSLVETDLGYLDRFDFLIVADYSNA